MLNLDPAKLLIIAVVAVILLGPDKLPQVARQMGAAWRTLNDFRHRMESEVRSSIPDLPSSAEIARLARSPSALLNHLSNMSPDGTEGAEGANGATTSADPASAESPVTKHKSESALTGLPIVPPSSVPPSSVPPSSVRPTSMPPSTVKPHSMPAAPRPPDVGVPDASDPSLN